MDRITCRTPVDDEKMAADLRIDIGADNTAFVAREEESFCDLRVQPCVIDGAGRGIESIRNVQGDGIASTHQHSSVIGHDAFPEAPHSIIPSACGMMSVHVVITGQR